MGLGEVIRICLSTNALVTGIMTVGLITIITYIALTFEKDIELSSDWANKLVSGLSEVILLFTASFVIIKVFESLTVGSRIELGSLFINAELTLFFYFMFIFSNRLIVILNIALPLLYHLVSDSQQHHQMVWPLFITAYVSLAIVTEYLYSHKDELYIFDYKYILGQILFGICWWCLLWIDFRWPLANIIGVLILFEVYMFIARIIEIKMENYFYAFNRLKQKVNYDALTGVRNRANLNKFSKVVYEEHRKDLWRPLTVIMFDIDGFKSFNDRYGHDIGDQVLRYVSHLVERELHLDDDGGKLFRYGGEEFLIIIEGINSIKSVKLVKAINRTLRNVPLFTQDMSLSITLSFGVTTLRSTDKSFSDVFKRADRYLYQSKNNGRNSFTVEGQTQSNEDKQKNQ
ncbi:GGDEF domain-containing protein [Companilactobacillus futsaii]|uniref:GGDEF domain-containing protein n=2 Tax=Companilactobacillus futsaii TaxID=938155 RepID=A0A5B7T0N6_9LACO|nr:GGDEF domain-containing protein [Companilactobacillus futsaii]KRK96593.1 diguanylate cyclase phosphodiesterase domain-containing protein [Companilactobacillus futsaii JCM 17355]QCX24114.1 GGDEF domain-containing protein [Companilactobacillus futsaii]